MPLIILSGLPCSGKSERAKKLNEYFSSSKKTIMVKEDEVPPSGFDRNIVFSSAQREKELRSSLIDEVERLLSQNAVLILDSGNYTKEYRNELYRLSKRCKTNYCVIYCDVLPEDCWAFNEQRPNSVQYNRKTFDALVERFESPRKGYDYHLFLSHKDEALPLSDIEDALFKRKTYPQYFLTHSQLLSSTSYLYNLDKLTQEIKAVQDAQKMSAPGDEITVLKAQQKLCKEQYLESLRENYCLESDFNSEGHCYMIESSLSQPFVDVCVKRNEVVETKKYLPKVKEENRVEYYIKAGLLEDAAEIAFKKKDINSLNQIQGMCGVMYRTISDKITMWKSQLTS